MFIHQHAQELLELPLALRRDQASLQQNGAQLIDQSGPLTDQTVPRPMKGLHIELVLALQFDKAHRWSRRRLRDPLGVAIVVLLPLDVGSNIFRRHQPNEVSLVTVRGRPHSPAVGALVHEAMLGTWSNDLALAVRQWTESEQVG